MNTVPTIASQFYNNTCNVCERIAKFFTDIQWILVFETIGAARAAAELARQGQHEAAQSLMSLAANNRAKRKAQSEKRNT
jgi:predicted DCC family thiol-disulfide oxidoreductase YuxK|tara:strand:- start:578 stop:817 length:240 start_codon:yes stop_codon:yes gene_type:complete